MRQLRKIQNYFWLKLNTKTYSLNIEKLGSDYGGWFIPQNFLNQHSVCYLAGAGLDISFDMALAEKYHSQVFIFDPTPKAKEHFEESRHKIYNNQEAYFNEKQVYQIQKENLKYLNFTEKGLWDQSQKIKFYAPANPKHISHSALNIQKTEKYFEAQVISLKEFMQEHDHTYLDLLKLDIEGSEYKVIDHLLEEKLDIKVICIEFDEIHSPLDKNYLPRIQSRIRALQKQNYLVINIDELYNFTFIREDIYQQLKGKE